MALTIYGSPRSRTMRVLWLAAELGLDYEHIPLAWDDPELKQPAFLKLNPAGTIPMIIDDGFALSESLAICLYLARKYGAQGPAPLYPTSPEQEAEVWRWSLWAQGHLEPWVQRDARMSDLRAVAAEAVLAMTFTPLKQLEDVLASRDWLVGDRFSIADFNACSVLSPSRVAHLDLARHPALRGWLERCRDRPAAVATRRRFLG